MVFNIEYYNFQPSDKLVEYANNKLALLDSRGAENISAILSIQPLQENQTSFTYQKLSTDLVLVKAVLIKFKYFIDIEISGGDYVDFSKSIDLIVNQCLERCDYADLLGFKLDAE